MNERSREEILKSKFKPLAFGTSGVRALVTDMTDMECYINTRGFIKYLLETNEIKEGDKIVFGGDLRSSTPRIMSAVYKAIIDENCQSLYCGFVPTPALSLYAWDKNHPAIMITGSHIPDDRNGIKFIKSLSEVLKTDEDEILRNVEIARKEEYNKSENDSLFNMDGNFKITISLPTESEEKITLAQFKERYVSLFQSDILKGKKVIVYEQSAVGRDFLKDVLSSLGAEVIGIERSDKFIPIDTEKMPDSVINSMKKWAEEYKPFAIVSLDGDSDRPILTDENGSFLSGDLLGLLVSLYLKPEFVSLPISSNDAAVSLLKDLNIEFVLTKIGSPYCIAAMNKKLFINPDSKVVSWERNGGYLLGNNWEINDRPIKQLPTRDSILPMLIAMVYAIREDVSLSRLIDTKLPHRVITSDSIDNHTEGCKDYTSETGKIIINNFSTKKIKIEQINFKGENVEIVPDDDKSNEIKDESIKIKSRLELYFNTELGYAPVSSINYIDGIRICFENNDVVHLRPSSNASEFRMYVTTDNINHAHKIIKDRLIIIPRIISDIQKGNFI